ncbi:hypothetical protein Enr13x_42370 [Stieleria neptunia]|uniref:Phage head-tail joining protein domain-containing protein n=1 Tax=Stieleria neptunia TaxID=2527979 RepID=A0A518HU47_9BACT|nr:hypothetical protein [Stieleria neptunia]QDV44372.1 hypothetical protein Enr13x_42370 [Stieleria neptunia]
MSLIDDALSLHADVLEGAAGEAVTYQFGDLTIAIEQAVRGQSRFDAVQSDGDVYTEVRTVDWIVRRALMIDPDTEETVEPSVGATITDVGGAVYDVIPSLNPTGWRWSDARRVSYRIHTTLRQSAS